MREKNIIKYVLESLEYSPFSKIGLTNFGATKNVRLFEIQNPFELGPTFLEVRKILQSFGKTWEGERICYAKLGA